MYVLAIETDHPSQTAFLRLLDPRENQFAATRTGSLCWRVWPRV